MWSFAKLLQLQLLRVLAPFKASLISEFKRWNRLNRKLMSSSSWIVLSSLISLHFPFTTPDESEDWQKIFFFHSSEASLFYFGVNQFTKSWIWWNEWFIYWNYYFKILLLSWRPLKTYRFVFSLIPKLMLIFKILDLFLCNKEGRKLQGDFTLMLELKVEPVV